MANYMYFHYTVEDKNNGTKKTLGLGTNGFEASYQNCWGNLAAGYSMQDNQILREINWFVEIQPKGEGSQFHSLEEVIEAFEYYFPADDKYKLKWEVTGKYLTAKDRENGRFYWPEIRIYDFEDYPRQLMIAKLFVIRNLSRYDNRVWRKLLEAGYPYGVATTIGSNLAEVKDFRGNVSWCVQNYASVIALDPDRSPTVADVRNFANLSRYLGEVGKPWSEGNGYKRTTEVMGSLRRITKHTNSPTMFSVGWVNGAILKETVFDILNRITGKSIKVY